MAVRKTESRIPDGTLPSDLGEAVVSADGRSCLVSFSTAPLVVTRENVYVLFVTDPALAATTQSFEWAFAEGEATTTTQVTQFGEIAYVPQSVGEFTVSVRLLNAGSAELAKLVFTQGVLPPNADLESIILGGQQEAGPALGNLEVARELVNDFNPYYQGVAPRFPETGDAFRRFVFGLARNGALQRSAAERKQQIEQLAISLNGDLADFETLVAQGVGVCNIRLPLLAMNLPENPGSTKTLLNWTELPETQPQRSSAAAQLQRDCAALSEPKRIDLFNLSRFPKSNLTQCGRIVESLRDRYFPGTRFDDVMTGLSGTRAHWIIKHFRNGPLQRG